MQSLLQRLEQGGIVSCAGVSRSAQPFLAAFLARCFPERPILLVAEGLKTQEIIYQDLSTWIAFPEQPETSKSQSPENQRKVMFYPSWEVLPHDSRMPHVDVIADRLDTLVALSTAAARESPALPEELLIVSSVAALLQRTFSRQALHSQMKQLARGDRIDPLDLVEWLEQMGYEPEAQVSQKGELSLRGGILDVFPTTSPWPVRIEFFGDEIESLRHFDPHTQISRAEMVSVTISPAGEFGLLKKCVGRAKESAATLLDHLPSSTLILLCEPEELDRQAQEYAREAPEGDPLLISWTEFKESAAKRGMTILAISEDLSGPPSTTPDPEVSPSACPKFENLDAFRPLGERAPEPHVAEAQRREFFAQLHRWLRQGYEAHVLCNNQGERRRFAEIWEEYGLSDPGAEAKEGFNRRDSASDRLTPQLHIGTLSRGFLFHEAGIVVVTDAEIFGRYKIQRPRRVKSPHAQATRSALDIDFTDLQEGDYVVHLQHGIGRYLGLQVLPLGAGTKPTEGSAAAAAAGQECLVLEYAPNDPAQPPPKLYVPVTEAHLVSKYVGTGKAHPPLNSLGGTRWAKAKAQAERAVRDVAGDLLSIQAARESQAGHPFAPDTAWQREFESAFLFEETPDQMRAIIESKADMERPKPMDRLICGDVGFGKTEVGIRAAFKAVMDGKQVAVLVPTTVLAQQHYNTFRERMADYPVRIELLSRFRTRRDQQRVIRELASGAVDIVIGTHRLLQSDISFKDLGLVVIDEEQRFGVLHKEKFKMLRQLVDVLTLSATPIPRTLYLALTGARDMSTIQTPPHDRLPVETIVTQYDERVIREAIRRELNRGGQVFFLHNRVATIEVMARKLQDLVPDARIVVGHGQMHSDDLEEVMTRFVNGEADILLSTTIIESGLDIPNANTIIIDRADRFGLSDLYQLRGRVGRYKHQAYAYLLLPRHAGLLADVRKRLSAIKQYSTLGSGFKIAMRDLEIRGAGNLLGAEQSGHITAVGFELYCQLLKQSVSSLKGEKITPRVDVQVRLDFLALSPAGEPDPTAGKPAAKEREQAYDLVSADLPRGPLQPSLAAKNPGKGAAPREPAAAAYIPFKYVSDARQRIEIYRKLAQISDQSSLENLEKELRDRFGPLPSGVDLLLKVAEIKVLAAQRGITSVEVKGDKLMLTRNNDFVMIGSKFPRLSAATAAGKLKDIRKLLRAL